MTRLPAPATTLIATTLGCLPLLAWGECSDAGICRLASASPSTGPHQTEPWLQVGLVASLAQGDKDSGVMYTTLTPQIAVRPYDGLQIALAVPFVSLDGDDGDASGVGDAVLTASQRIGSGAWGDWAIHVGARIGTGDDNANPGLPQAYQPGLGGTDFLIGLGWNRERFSAAVGYALAAGANDLTGTELERGDDLALSFGYRHPLSDSWEARARVVGIYRLAESTISDSGSGREAVSDSDGLQINIRAGLGFSPTAHLRVDFGAALPLLRRDSDVDGLTRAYAIEAGATISW